MTVQDNPEPKRSVYDSCDPEYLRQLRESAGVDRVVLARKACLSVAQVRQLEAGGGASLFYSDAIRKQAYKRLLMLLGAEPPTAEVPGEFKDAGRVAQAHLNTLDQIVAMSHQPAMGRASVDVIRQGLEKVKAHKQVVAASMFLALAVALFMSQPFELQVAPTLIAKAPPEPTKKVNVENPVGQASAEPALPTPLAEPKAVTVPKEAAAASAEPAVGTAAANKSLPVCGFSNDAMPQLTSLFAQKEGRYVYLVSQAASEVCVVDASKQATLVQLKAGESRSVYGAAPWQISGANLAKVQIYFQGGRIAVPDTVGSQFKLIEVPIVR